LLKFSLNHSYEYSENFQEKMANKLKYDEKSHKLLIHFVENINDENISQVKERKRGEIFYKGLSQNSLNNPNIISYESLKNLKKTNNFHEDSKRCCDIVNFKNQLNIMNIGGKETFINNNFTYMININNEKSIPLKRNLSSFSKYPKNFCHYFQINIPLTKIKIHNPKSSQLTFDSFKLEVNIITTKIELLKSKSYDIKTKNEKGVNCSELKTKLNYSKTFLIDIIKKKPEIKLEIAKENLLDWLNENRQRNEKELAEKEFFYLVKFSRLAFL